MSQDTSLQDLILGYCLQVGGLVEPPAYGIYEVLLPEKVANRWGIASHQQFTFPTDGELYSDAGAAGQAVTLLHYGHPLVETITEELRLQYTNGIFYINNIRLEKPSLFTVIDKSLAFPNARLFPVSSAVERKRLYHYVRFNFKASLIADEKRELIFPVWMHLQHGYAVEKDELERLAALDAKSQFHQLNTAGPLWLPKPAENLLAEDVLRPLLERAHLAARELLTPNLETLHRRLQRYLELDQARLQGYYDDLKKVAERRLVKAKADRRPALEAKIAAIEAERRAKLADVEQKYRIRVDLELINLAVIAQPKLDLRVEIKKRSVATQRRVTWDPLRHVIEPLACDVCGLPGEELHLCENSHLTHSGCQAPQCVDCKRIFCLLCAESVQTCVVCDRPVCVHSQVRCPSCQRVTCQEHKELCHAADGEPQLVKASSGLAAISEQAAPSNQHPQVTKQPEERKLTSNKPPSKPSTKKKPARREKASTKSSTSKKALSGRAGAFVEVYSDPRLGIVSAYLMVRKREIAVRTWELTSDGIAVHCRCEDWFCAQNGLVYRPGRVDEIEQQIMFYLREFIDEYDVLEKKLRFFRQRRGDMHKERRLILTGKWKDPAVLEKARIGFGKLD